MRNRHVGGNAMAQVKYMGAVGESGNDGVDRLIKRFAAREQRQRVKIALHGQSGGQNAVGPDGIDRFVEPERVNAGFARIGAKLARPRLSGNR